MSLATAPRTRTYWPDTQPALLAYQGEPGAAFHL